MLEAFAQGVGGTIPSKYEIQEGYSAFYGVVGIESLWREAKARGFYYADNSFFDAARGSHYRLAKDRLQDWSLTPDWNRYKQIGIEVKPWRKGRHILVAMQSDHFMREVVEWNGGALGWQDDVLRFVRESTDRPIVVRHWSRDKSERARSLKTDLEGAHLLVTHASAAANEALLEGVPVYVTDPLCAAASMSSEEIETPSYPEGREEWAARLCNSMWTLEEMRRGIGLG